MASSSTAPAPVGPDTQITIKINSQGVPRKLKLPLKDLVPTILPLKLREFLGVVDSQAVVFERFSDSSASYVSLDPSDLHAYKTLYRAAKAKLKLRLRAHVGPAIPTMSSDSQRVSVPSDIQTTLSSLANLRFSESSAAEPVVPTKSYSEMETRHGQAMAAMRQLQSGPDTVAAAIADFAASSQQSVPSNSTSFPSVFNIPVQSAAEAKSADFHKKVREIDEQLKLKIGAHRAKQSAYSSTFSETVHVADSAEKRFAIPRAESTPEAMAKEAFKLHPSFQPQKGGCPGPRMSHPPRLPDGATYSWSVYCNHCNKNMLDEHYHCNSCENGDYDLCVDCMSKGKHCLDENHWLIKRYLRNGKVINGTTQKHCFASSPALKSETSSISMPGAFTEEKKPEDVKKPTRTCNCCVKVFDEDAFVTCEDCDDYDLCVPCLEDSKHGHHPAHSFSAATKLTKLSPHAKTLCKPGRNVSHAAVCDECNNRIVGVRHKCLVCPDFDYCSTCHIKSATIHRGHRFAPVYESITPQAIAFSPTHVGVYCDGPSCKNKSVYISGIRWKCAICPDLDFCAGCEALPHLNHNRTHPLLKFHTPVRGCNITTMVDEKNTRAVPQEQASKIPVQTVAEVKPSSCMSKCTKEKIEIKDIISGSAAKTSSPAIVDQAAKIPEAVFVRDTIADGTTFEADAQFVQVWTLKNPGPEAWPAGCSVRYVGGDNMLNIDNDRPSSETLMDKAIESNVVRRSVLAGEEISFRVLMKAPSRDGVFISYWRLKTNDGTPFGHRLWCHIVVKGNKAVCAEGTETREVGRRGAQDAFLRYALTEQQCNRRQGTTSFEELQTLREALREQRAHNGLSLVDINKTAFPDAHLNYADRAKIEVVESTEKNVVESSQELTFPTLDVESSVSSSSKEQIATNGDAAKNVVAVAPASSSANADLFDDAESIDLLDDSSSDDGFMTEDEYDILDASDEETV